MPTSKVDKLCLTIPVARELWNTVSENFWHYSDIPLIPKRIRYDNTRRQIYEFSWNFPIPGLGNDLPNGLLQAHPTSTPNASYLRIEWNPARCEGGGAQTVYSVCNECIPNFSECWENSRISRIDIALDVYRLAIDQLLIFTHSSRPKLKAFPTGFYLGSRKSNRQLCVYDKRHEIEVKKSRLTSETEFEIRLMATRSRIECKLKDIGRASMLRTLPNKLSGYTVALTNLAKSYSKNIEWQIFLSNCDRIGTQDALKNLASIKKKALYKRILSNDCCAIWYDHQKIWLDTVCYTSELLGF